MLLDWGLIMASSGSMTVTSNWTSDAGYKRSYIFSWTATQNIAKNTSTISWKVVTGGTYTPAVACWQLHINVAGESVYSEDYRTNGKTRPMYTVGTTIASGTKTITHNSSGNATFSVSLQSATYYSDLNGSGSQTFTLNQIPRQATITAAPDFNDEANPTITYSNPAGNNVTTLQACISLDGSSANIAYRDISKTGTTYTFNLTEAERNVLRNATKTAKSRTVKFYVKTVIAGNTYYSNLTKTLTIVNANPVITCDAVDENAATLALTGDPHKWIRYYSHVNATGSAVGQKGATISRFSGNAYTTKINQDSFTFSAVDSRGNSSTKTASGTLIPYVDLTANFKPEVSVGGTATIEVKGNYYNGSFGAVNNTLTLQYRYKPGSGTYSSWTNYTPSISGNEHNTTISFAIPNFDYRSSYTFQVRVIDKLATVEASEYSANALPVFDWSADDFNFNVPVAINGGLTIDDNPVEDYVIETGTDSMGSNGTWYWRKWASGRAECYGCRNYGNMGVSTTWGVLYRSEVFSQSLPSGLFTAVPEVIDITFRSSNFGAWIAKHETSAPSTTNSGSFIVIRPASATLSQAYISFNVIGRWK